MKVAQALAGGLVGLMYLFAAVGFFLMLGKPPPPMPPDSPAGLFMGATFATGFMAFVKAFEALGGLLVAIPRTRALGLLILVPVTLNIVAFHVFVAGGGLLNPMLVAILVLTAFLVWSHRRGVVALMTTA